MSFQQLDMPNEDAVRHPPVPAELQQYAGTQALTTTSTQQGLQQVVGASSFRDIPGQLALPGINEPTQEALNDGTQSTMSCPAAAEGNSHARYHTPSASDPSTAAPLLRPESYVPTVSSRRDARSHQVLPGIVLLVGRMGRDVIDTLVAFDSGSPFCYISKCEAMRLGLNIAEWVHNKFYPTSRGGFNPRLFAISTRIRSSMQGLNDTDIALDIAIAPKIWGKVPLTLGLRAMKKLRNQSQIFCRNTDRHIHPHVLRL